MEAGIARVGRTFLAVLSALAVMISVMFVLIGPASADHAPDDVVPHDGPAGTNNAPFWVGYLAARGIDDAVCAKVEQSGDEAYVLGNPPAGSVWVMLVVKQANSNFVFMNPVPNHAYASTGQQAPGFSHVIQCWAPEPEETTTTTEVEETTTTTEVEETTTTTEVEETTTTTIEDEVLGTTVTTQPAETTTSIEDEVLAQEVLPFTGPENAGLAVIAAVLTALGLLVTLSARRIEE